MAIYAALKIPMYSRTMPIEWEDSKKTSFACQAMIGMGGGEIIGSLANGKLNDKFGIKVYLWICVAELTLAYIMMFWYNERDTFSLPAGCATAFCWGL